MIEYIDPTKQAFTEFCGNNRDGPIHMGPFARHRFSVIHALRKGRKSPIGDQSSVADIVAGKFPHDGAISIPPKGLEARRRQRRIANRVLDVLVAQVVLQMAGIDAIVSKLKTTSVPEHVRMSGKAELGGDTKPRHHLAITGGRERRTAI
jgi:hypothetical protein